MDEIAAVAASHGEAIQGVADVTRGQVSSMTRTVESSQSLVELSQRMDQLVRRVNTGPRGGEQDEGGVA